MKNLLTVALAALIAACSHPIEIVGEGDVSSNTFRFCMLEGDEPGETNCSENYVVDDYQVTYYAEPRNGWQFDSWENCVFDGISTEDGNSCSFDVQETTVHNAWGSTMPPLRAIFVEIPGAPISDIVIAGGKEWAQPDLFLSLTWNEINVVCPSLSGGICNGGTLNGYDMSGWTWASVDDVNALFNVFLIAGGVSGSDLLSGPDSYLQAGSAWAPALFDQGFRPIVGDEFIRSMWGWTSTPYSTHSARIGSFSDLANPEYNDNIGTNSVTGIDEVGIYDGAYFYRTDA